MATEVPGFCCLCRSRCGTINTVENGRLLRVEADPSHPTGRAICAKGRAGPEIAHRSGRLTTPLRRTRPKTEANPGWQPISWDAAMSEIAERLSAQRAAAGAESVAFAVTSPSGTPISDAIDWIERFIRVFGSPNTAYATEICNWHKDFSHAFTFGRGIGTPDYARAKLILLWGHNPSSVWLAQAGAIAEGRKVGAKMIVVDPRRTAHAAQAEHWLRVRPGADAALALGLIRRLIAIEGYNTAFVRRFTNAALLVRCDDGMLLRVGTGFAEFDTETFRAVPAGTAASAALRGVFMVGGVRCRPVFDLLTEACAPFTPAAVEAMTSVPAATLMDAAAAIAAAGDAVAYYCWTGVGQHADATQTDRAIAVLMALTGSSDARGGNRDLVGQPVNKINSHDLLLPEQRAKALGLASRPLGPAAHGYVTAADLYHAILDHRPYAVRALVSFGANLLVSHAGPERGKAALEALDFHVHCDLVETPTSRFADILLPVNSLWEREALRCGFEIDEDAEDLIQLRPKMIDAVGQSRSDMQIVFDLAVRLGHGEAFYGGDIEAGWNHVLAPTGLTVADLRAQPAGIRRAVAQLAKSYTTRSPAFPTETGLIELYSERLLRHGYSPVPIAAEAPERTNDAFPLVLTTAKSGYFCHSQQRGIASLRKRAMEPMAELAPDLAAAHGIAEGDWITLSTRIGTARFRARLNASLHPDVIVADYGWWEACADLGMPGYATSGGHGSNYNALISAEHADPISGSVPHRSFACAVSRLNIRSAWSGWRGLRVAALKMETRGVVSVTLESPDGELPDYRPGQHLPLRLEGVKGHRQVMRSYSLSGAAEVVGRRGYRITVRRVPGGVGSGHITRRMRVGDRVEAQAPGGRFVIPMVAEFPVVLLAAGIGITPFIAALETLAAQPNAAAAPIILHYGNRNRRDHAFRGRLRALAKKLPNLSVINHYSRPLDDDRLGRDYDAVGRISADSIAPELIEARARFYLCGPEAMLRDLPAGLVARGVPRFEIFLEAFGITAIPASVDAGASHRVRFARSDRDLVWTSADGSLLDLAEANGLTPPSGCRVGQCESCAVPVLEGQFHYLTHTGSDEPENCLTCCAIPASDLVLDA